jgi:isoleucyl-tRNA synthetase
MFDELRKETTFPQLESEILKFWEAESIFHKSLAMRESAPRFVFYEGPPTANGRPGVHHVITRTLKDTVCRYKQMRGFRVDRKAGWDTHGLPVEIEVEKQLKLESKAAVERYGIAEFNRACRASVFKYLKDWDELTTRIGYWLDLDQPYVTCDNSYMESVWYILSDFFKRGLIYQGHKILPYCPRCETGLSSHEVAQGYKEVEDPSVFVKVRAADDPDLYYLVWTTTPWTLISNVALAVQPNADYVRVKYGGEQLLLAEALAEKVLKDGYEVIGRMKGSDLEHKRYEPMFEFYRDSIDNAYFITNADFVTLDDGTGIVHMAPAFGADDYSVGQKYGLPILQAVETNGRFKSEVTDWAGMFIKDADPLIIRNLKERGRLFRKEKYPHSYPFCWRCDTPLVYYARKSWYIRTSEHKDKLISSNRQVNWCPPEIGEGRFGEWLENNVDWALSRERYWGTPLPIWICDSCGEMTSIGSVRELREKGDDVPEELDLHRPFVDAITLKCKCGEGTMRRTPEVIDCWFDSGAMPFAQYHYPFERSDELDQFFPADFISEATDQTRGWFYSLTAIATLFKNSPAFKNVVVIGFTLDKDGLKMSKSKGNALDPWDILGKNGADALRWYLISSSQPWLPTRFDTEGLAESERKFLHTLKNTYSFFALYANLDEVTKRGENSAATVAEYLESKAGPAQEIDRWILSALNSLTANVTERLDRYDLTTAYRRVSDFVIDDLSNWYVRRCRRRFWASADNADKYRAYSTLYECLLTVSKTVAPIMPFFSEFIYRELRGKHDPGANPSVHMEEFPKADEYQIDKALEERMGAAQKIVNLARAARTRVNLKVRQPLAEMRVQLPAGLIESDLEHLKPVIADELNIKAITYSRDAADLMSLKAKPNFKILGPKLGKKIGLAKDVISGLKEHALRDFLKAGKLAVSLEGEEFILTREDLEVESIDKEGFAAETDGNFVVAISTVLSESLIQEGIARELVNKIQNMRKTSGFEVTDRISVSVSSIEAVLTSAKNWGGYIKGETLADDIVTSAVQIDGGQKWDINGHVAYIRVNRV